MSCCVRLWKGFLSTFFSSGDVAPGVPAAEEACPMLRKKGFFDSAGGLVTADGLVTPSGIGGAGGGDVTVGNGGAAGGGGGDVGGSCTLGSSILWAGVLSVGVMV